MASSGRDTAAAARKAALLGASFAWWKQNNPNIYGLPQQIRPPSVDSLPAVLRQARPAGDGEGPLAYLARRSVVGTLVAAQAKERYLRALMKPEEWESSQKRLHDDQRRHREGGTCPFCDFQDGLDDRNQELHQQAGVVRMSHPPVVVKFDDASYITAASVTGFQLELDDQQLQQLLHFADPRNWARPGNEFFLNSAPGLWRAGQWKDDDDPDRWTREKGGQIYEHTNWQWNTTSAADVHNILNISQFVGSPHSLRYDYSLQHTIGSNLTGIWEPGGLDVDNGHYSAVGTRKNGRWLVTIDVEKRVRYTAPRVGPAEFGMFFNLMGPALVGMLIRKLVYGSLDELGVTAGQAPASPRRGNE